MEGCGKAIVTLAEDSINRRTQNAVLLIFSPHDPWCPARRSKALTTEGVTEDTGDLVNVHGLTHYSRGLSILIHGVFT